MFIRYRHWGGKSGWVLLSSRLAWSIYQVPGQRALHSVIISKKEKHLLGVAVGERPPPLKVLLPLHRTQVRFSASTRRLAPVCNSSSRPLLTSKDRHYRHRSRTYMQAKQPYKVKIWCQTLFTQILEIINYHHHPRIGPRHLFVRFQTWDKG